MAELEITASTGVEDLHTGEEENREATIVINYDDSLEGLLDLLNTGDNDPQEVAKDFILRRIKQKAAQDIRRELQSGTDPENVPENFTDWNPAESHSVEKDPVQKILEQLENLPEDERESRREILLERLAG